MTNLQGASGGAKLPITPEQALVVLPALGGVVLAAVLAAAGLLPLNNQLKQQSERLSTYRDQEQQLPLLRRQQSALLEQLDTAERKESRLISLVSDVDQLDTILTALNQLATATGAVIMTVEPEKQAAPAAAKPGAAPAEEAAKPKTDERFLKRSYLLVMEGSYGSLLEFLRRLETLNTAVLVSDLEITVGKSGVGAQGGDASSQAGALTMKLRLTAYQRAPKQVPQDEAPGDQGDAPDALTPSP
jgi:Tfp pilus assembly protein PilO